MSMEKEVSFKTTNTYSTLNTITNKNQNTWFACHGLGQLSHYFLNNFSNISKKHNYIIAPQAPSKFYQSTKTKRVGACWLTKENTQLEQENILRYFNEILNQEKPVTPNIFMGFSQGVSVMLRWLLRSPSKHGRRCAALVDARAVLGGRGELDAAGEVPA